MTDGTRLARVALACLVEPGSTEIYTLVAERGPVEALGALIAGTVAAPVAGAARARLAEVDARDIAEAALARTERLGARVVIPEDDEWPAQLGDLCRISRPGGQHVDPETYPPVCGWGAGAPPLSPDL